MKRVLVVGGSGDVGQLVVPLLQRTWKVRILDPGQETARTDVEHVRGTVLDYEVVAHSARDCDAVLYMAMGPKNPDTWERPSLAAMQFELATTGMYIALRAAAANGIRHFVYASSMSVFADFAKAPPPPEYGAPDATHFYGLAKRLGEALLESTSNDLGMSAWALRLCFPADDQTILNTTDALVRQTGIAASDLSDAFDAALRSTLAGFHAIPISSDTVGRYVNLTAAQVLLGWSPRIIASASPNTTGDTS